MAMCACACVYMYTYVSCVCMYVCMHPVLCVSVGTCLYVCTKHPKHLYLSYNITLRGKGKSSGYIALRPSEERMEQHFITLGCKMSQDGKSQIVEKALIYNHFSPFLELKPGVLYAKHLAFYGSAPANKESLYWDFLLTLKKIKHRLKEGACSLTNDSDL